ncbi:MAG: hypothetical protein RP166_2650 [Rapeseed phyllody phytoplasma]|uniref:Uncharacterized protein n=1 Tax=Rapeseed phyllody phytoplasma TaxID=2490543 RepID=A0A859I9K4_9MOLU|nr:MAG: hypothetical protein RP166_2650 [Rapeseed phyllody phytoplasma]
MEEIQKQIANYKNMVSELEQETKKLKEQIAKNNENTKQLQEKLLTKQTQINKINQELVSLSNQQISLQQELNNLTQLFDEWEKNCEIKANEIASNLDLKNVKRVIDQKIYYSTEPFTVELKPFNPYQPQKNENKQTINSLEIKINNVKYYYIKFSFYYNFFCIKDKDLNEIHRIYNITKSPTDWMFQFSHNVSETLPPTKLNNYKSLLEQKNNDLSEIKQQLTKKQQELNKYQQECTDLIINQKPDDTLQQELNNKETHIKTLKNEMQQLKIKEQGFRSEIDTLKLENKNLKEKYTNDLNKIQEQLNTSKTENEQLEKEIKEIQDELVKNGNANEALVNQLNNKQTQIKDLKGKINILEANEIQLQEIINQKDEEIAKLQQTIQEQAEQIIKLTAEIETNMKTFKQQAIKIQQLEGAISGLEGASGSLGFENKELQHEIEKLKEQLRTEQLAHKAMKKQLDDQILRLEEDKSTLTTKADQLKIKTSKWDKSVERTGAVVNTVISTKSGAIIGASLGSAILPGVGTIIGGGIGGLISGAASVASKWDTYKQWLGW